MDQCGAQIAIPYGPSVGCIRACQHVHAHIGPYPIWSCYMCTLVSPSREPNRPLRTFMRNYQGKSEADCSHNAEKGKSYFPYITISLLLKLIRDKSYVPYSIVILLLKAQKIDVSDALHIYVICTYSYTRSMPTVFQCGTTDITSCAP